LGKSKIKKKICLLGSYGVGKTSLVRKYVYDKFEERYLSTLGVNITKKIVDTQSNSNNTFELIIWDIANIEKFDSVVKNYLSGAHGAIIVTDVTRHNTTESVSDFVKNFLNINENAKYVIVGNKIDLFQSNSFDKEKYLSKIPSGAAFYFTSAKTGENIEQVFSNLCSQFV